MEGVEFFKVIRTIFGTAWKRYRKHILVAAVLATISGLMQATAPKLLQQIIDLLIKNPSMTEQTHFWVIVAYMAAATFFAVITKFFTSKISFYVATQTEDYWRFRVLDHYYKLPVLWHDQRDSGQIGSQIDRGGSAIYILINDMFGQDLFVSLITLIIVLIAALLQAPTFWWVFLLPIPIYVMFTYIVGDRLSKHQEELNRLADDANRSLFDGISNVRSVKSFGKEIEETKRYEEKWSLYHEREYRLETLQFTRTSVQNMLELGMKAVLIILSFYAVINSQMTVGTMVLLIAYQALIFGPLGQLNSIFSRVRRVVRRSASLFDIVNEPDTLADSPQAQDLGSLHKQISIENLTFHYGKIPALEGVSVHIKAGTTTALIGRSGSGKSTLSMLLLRFHDPTSGAIRWDGTDIRHATRRSLRRHIAIVPQDTSLFNRTIRENIAYGKQDATMPEVVEASKRAHAHDFIMKMPNSYESIIGERGVKLSGGQRQRIAIARSLLLEPSLLILDESTSHLDSESEHAIQQSIKDLHHKTTQVIIAHRMSTVLHADQILVMDKGRVVASGKHKELLRSNRIYKNLYKLQFKRSS